MEYMTVKEAAKEWNISERLTQRYCTEGRIEGAVKFSGAWAIPKDAVKPEDPRKKRVQEKDSPNQLPRKQKYGTAGLTVDVDLDVEEPSKPHIPMPLLNTPFKPGHCMEAIVGIEDQDERNIALGEYYYFSGKSEKAIKQVEQYLESEDLALRLSACLVCGYACLATNNIAKARQVMANAKAAEEMIDENTPKETLAFSLFISVANSVLLHMPVEKEMPSMREYIGLLPPGLKCFALYIQAHAAYLSGKYYECIGMAEAALSVEAEQYPIAEIYLHLVATMANISRKNTEAAKDHFMAAWEIAQPDDLIEGFGEHHGLLGGMIEVYIKKDWPEAFQKIIDVTYNFSSGWRKIHNPATGHDVAENLTTTEFTIAMLAAKGWSNKEISAHLGVSANTIKHHMSVILQKLGITQRKDLSQFMLK